MRLGSFRNCYSSYDFIKLWCFPMRLSFVHLFNIHLKKRLKVDNPWYKVCHFWHTFRLVTHHTHYDTLSSWPQFLNKPYFFMKKDYFYFKKRKELIFGYATFPCKPLYNWEQFSKKINSKFSNFLSYEI